MSYRDVFRLCCPACKQQNIYDGVLTVLDCCPKCGFELKKHDAGDGPAFFAMFFASVVVILAALWVDHLWPLSFLQQVTLWGIVTVALSIYLLRVIKVFLIYQQYKHNVDHYRQ